MPANVQQHPVRERRAAVPPSAHPADSSRILMTLLSLVRAADETSDAPLGNQYDDLVKPGVLRSLLSALHYRDEATVYHSRRVALAAVGIAGELGWDEAELRVLEIAAMLHDLGKIGVPDSILRKPAALSPDEAELVAQNHNVGLTILQACRVNNRVIELIAQAARCPVAVHSASRGNGDMQLGARILAVSDMYDSLIHDQSYRSHLSHGEAINALIESDRQLDRNVIAALRRWLAGEARRCSPTRSTPPTPSAPVRRSIRPPSARPARSAMRLRICTSSKACTTPTTSPTRTCGWSCAATD
jgi:HD-GYP domain-containing protein (c-di-GMP phosphodiesterase class II)